MKRLIVLLFAVLFSTFAGVEYILPKDDNFYMSSIEGDRPYFKVNEDGEVLYRGLYRLIRYTNLDTTKMRGPAFRQSTRDSRVEIPDVSGLNGIGDIWHDLYSSATRDKYTATKMSTKDGTMLAVSAAENVNIIAPTAGEINISHYACDGGSTMEYLITWSDGSVYAITILGAKYWYCCAHKSVPKGEFYTVTTSDSLKGKAIRTGDVFCIGEEGTTISIVRTST